LDSAFYLRIMRNLSLIWVLALVIAPHLLLAQSGAIARPRRSTPIPEKVEGQRGGLIQVGLGGYQPSGAWTHRFGSMLDVQASYSLLNGATLIGLDLGSLHSSQVKNMSDVLNFLLTPEGEILSNDGSYGSLRIEMRGWQMGGHIGQRYPLNPLGPAKSTWYWKVKGGVMQHKIAFMSSGGVPMLAAPYTYGMDELRRGPFVSEELGFLHLGRIAPHFALSLVAFQGYMLPIRGYSFTLQGPTTAAQWDAGWGIRATWILPMLQEKSAIRFYY